MAFVDGVRVEAGFLKLAIHVAGEPRVPVVHGLTPVLEDLEPDMGLGLAVEVEPVPIKAPGRCRMGAEGRRAGDAVEVHLLPAQSRIGLPEARLAPKARQS